MSSAINYCFPHPANSPRLHGLSVFRRPNAAEIGLLLDDEKCKLLNKNSSIYNPAFQNFTHLKTEKANLLGTAMKSGIFTLFSQFDYSSDKTWIDRCKCTMHLSNLKVVQRTQIMHTKRASPCSSHATLEKFHGQL